MSVSGKENITDILKSIHKIKNITTNFSKLHAGGYVVQKINFQYLTIFGIIGHLWDGLLPKQ